MPVHLRVAAASAMLRQVSVSAIGVALSLSFAGTVARGATPLPSQATPLPAPYGSAANGVIVYDANGDIYLADASGASATPLIATADDDFFPTFSPDGTRIAFGRNADDQTGNLMVARADGAGTVQVATSGDNYAWSPDGTRFAMGQIIAGKQVISVVATDGTADPSPLDLGSVQPLADFIAWRPPVGAEILFLGHPQAGTPQLGLYAIAPDGSGLRAIGAISTIETATSGSGDHFSFQLPTLSPDGRTILFGNWEPGSRGIVGSYLHVRDLTSGEDRLLTFDGHSTSLGTAPLFSPDGTSFIVSAPSSTTADAAQLVIAAADGSGPAVAIGPEYAYGDRQSYVFSPDGKKVLLDLVQAETYILDTAGGLGAPSSTFLSDPSWQRLAR